MSTIGSLLITPVLPVLNEVPVCVMMTCPVPFHMDDPITLPVHHDTLTIEYFESPSKNGFWNVPVENTIQPLSV